MIVLDQLNRKINIASFPPKRIVSLVPSQTELLSDLKLDNQVIGITKYCVHPEDWRFKKTIIGGTKNFNISKIKSLNPDLIIANKEENSKDKLELLMKDYPVWISDVKDLDSAVKMIHSIGLITGSESTSRTISNEIISSIKVKSARKEKKNKVVYLIWNKPIMTVNNDTFINSMLNIGGWENCFASHSNRYPQITLDEINKVQPDYIFLSSEPFPFSEKHILRFSNEISDAKVILVNGEFFSWYGSRLKQSMAYLNEIMDSTV